MPASETVRSHGRRHGLWGHPRDERAPRVMIEVVLARKIQVQIWAIFGSLYKYGQSGATRRSSQREYIAISSITYPS